MKVDIAIPDLPKLVENAATIGEPAALHSKFYKAILALAGTGGGGISGRQLARAVGDLEAAQVEAAVAMRK